MAEGHPSMGSGDCGTKHLALVMGLSLSPPCLEHQDYLRPCYLLQSPEIKSG